MKKHGSDSKVEKTLVRNFERKKKPGTKELAIHDMGCSSNLTSNGHSELNQPSLCSSEALAQYLSDVKNSIQAPNVDDLRLDKCQLGAKVTKKLNFHFNDRIYKNLIELNANIDEVKKKRDKRPSSASIKRDLEPNIEDFCHDEVEHDIVPSVPIIKPKMRPVKKVESGQLHELIASFEDL